MKHYEMLYEHAVDNNGVVTAAAAARMGLRTSELTRFCADGRIERVGYGVYRLTHFVPTSVTPYAEAVALVGEAAFLYGESVLAMHGLAPTDPRWTRVATPARVRRRLPGWLLVTRVPTESVAIEYEGVRSQPVADALLSCARTMLPDRVMAAAHEAFDAGLVTAEELNVVVTELENGR